jgi:hypothetical protein
MSAKKKSSADTNKLELYRALVDTIPEIELKGATRERIRREGSRPRDPRFAELQVFFEHRKYIWRLGTVSRRARTRALPNLSTSLPPVQPAPL